MGADIKINPHRPVEVRRILEAIYNDLTALAAKLNYAVTHAIFKIGTTTHEIGHEAFKFMLGGTEYHVAADATLACTDADTINTGAAAGSYWGAWLIQATAAGVVSTTSVSSDQVYASEALAIAALPDPDADNVAVGYFTVNANDDSAWTMKTDDFTGGSDCASATFYDGDPDNALVTLETLNG